MLKCGDPAIAEVGATFSPETSENGWFGMPDNCVIDAEGRLWVSTDGNNAEETGRADGLWAVISDGENLPVGIHYLRCPVGAELCGPSFTPDLQSLFAAVQHPAEGGRTGPSSPSSGLRQPVHALAGLPGRHAAAAIGCGHHQARGRPDRRLTGTASCNGAALPLHPLARASRFFRPSLLRAQRNPADFAQGSPLRREVEHTCRTRDESASVFQRPVLDDGCRAAREPPSSPDEAAFRLVPREPLTPS